MPSLPPTLLVLPLAVATAILPGDRARAWAVVGCLGYLLPLAALRLDGWSVAPLLAPPSPTAATPWLVATGGLVVAAAVAWGGAVLVGFRGLRSERPLALRAATAALLAGGGFVPAWPLVAGPGLPRVALAGAGLAVAAGLCARAGAALRLRAVFARLVTPFRLPSGTPGPGVIVAGFAGFLLVAFGPLLHLVLTGVALLLVLTLRTDLRARAVRAVAADLAALLALLVTWWLLGTIAGDALVRMREIGALPLSPAAEYLLVPLLGVVLFRLAGTPPLDGPTGAVLAGAAALLAVRLVLPALPGALPAWSAGVLALAALGALAAGAVRRSDLLLAAAGLAALLAGGEAGRHGGTLLLVAAPLARAGPGAGDPARRAALRPIAGVVLAWAAGESLTGTISAEVTYSIVVLLGAIALAWPAPLTPPPRGGHTSPPGHP